MRRAAAVMAIGVVICGGAVTGCASASASPPTAGHAGTLRYGVTLDDLSHLGALVASLRALPRRMTVRIVFDPGTRPADYRQAIARVSTVADILAEPVDSSAAAGYTTREYAQRFRQFVGAFAGRVWAWEIGNEVNGDWLGKPAVLTNDIAQAYGIVRAHGRTALTLSYEPGCAASPANDMFTWAERHVPGEVKQGLDYVLVSYYADDCGGYQPARAEWKAVFVRLHRMFPHARLGFGEVGTHLGDSVRQKLATLRWYYGLRIDVPGYIGGWFWWYYAEDMIPCRANPLWQALAAAIAPTPAPRPRAAPAGRAPGAASAGRAPGAASHPRHPQRCDRCGQIDHSVRLMTTQIG